AELCESLFRVFFFQAEDGIRDRNVTGVQTCALPICSALPLPGAFRAAGTGRRLQARTVRACSAYGAGPRRRNRPRRTYPPSPAKEAAMPLTFPQMPDKLTANEAAVLEYITRNSDSFLFMSIAQLAAALDVSEATISRFARHVGCRDFKHLK